MPEAREFMDVYTGSEENEQLDMWLSIRDLRTQFDAVDRLAWKRDKKRQAITSTARPGSIQKLWSVVTKHCPWPGHIRSAGAKS